MFESVLFIMSMEVELIFHTFLRGLELKTQFQSIKDGLDFYPFERGLKLITILDYEWASTIAIFVSTANQKVDDSDLSFGENM